MDLEQFLSLLSALLGALGSIYVLRNILHLTPDKIERISASIYGHNANHIRSLSEQKAENLIGTVLIMIALIINILNVIISPTNIIVLSAKPLAILISILIVGVIYFVMIKISGNVERNTSREVAKIIISKKLDKLCKSMLIPQSEFQSLCFVCNKFLELNQQKDETDIEFLYRIAHDVGQELPKGVRFNT